MAFSEQLFLEFQNLGNVSQKDASAAVQIYLELCEVKKYWDIEYKFHDELKTLYFTARRSKSEEKSIFVPRCSSDELSFNQLRKYLTLDDDSTGKNIFLCFISADSTCVYYQISDGLCGPIDSNPKHSRSHKNEKINNTIHKHKTTIMEAALCGTSITINENQKML